MSDLLLWILENESQFRRARLPSLYSDFRHLKTVNPDGYAANISAWKNALAHAAGSGKISTTGRSVDRLLIHAGEDLMQQLATRNFGRPLALGAVFNESTASKDLYPLEGFNLSADSIYTSKWAISPWQLLRFGWRVLGLASGAVDEDKLPVGKFVVISTVEEAAANIAKRVAMKTNPVDRIYSKASFKQEFSDAINSDRTLSDTDLDIILVFLKRDKRLIAYDGKTIKFYTPDEARTALTSQDATVASLKTLIASLHVSVAELSSRIDTLAEKARVSVISKNRVAAMSALRLKKLNETALDQKTQKLSTLEEIFGKIQQAEDNVAMMKLMESSTTVLKSLHAQTGGVDRVEDVVTNLRDEMDKVDEVGTALEAGSAFSALDEEAVDEELAALERDALQAKAAEAKPEKDVNTMRDEAVEKQLAALNRLSLEDPVPQLPLIERKLSETHKEAASAAPNS